MKVYTLKLYSYGNRIHIIDGLKMWVYDGETIVEVEGRSPEFPKEGE